MRRSARARRLLEDRNGVIVFTPDSTAPLFRVSAAGGKPTQITELDNSQNETSCRFPWFLPDGRDFLFLTRSPGGENNGIYAGELEGKQRKRILLANSTPSMRHPDCCCSSGKRL